MDLNVGISYNSLIWTKVDSAMIFDTDFAAGMTPGFRVGFPTIEPSYYNDDLDKWNYLMIGSSGGKIEFRQTNGAPNVYETYDSSYAQLTTIGADDPSDPVEDIVLKVVTTDGTQMFYDWISGAFRCTAIRDRNGNYISITYDTSDRGIATITDTLGRVIAFNYTGFFLSSITQTWKDTNGSGSNTTHTYATFSYATKEIQTDFDSSLTAFGIVNGTDLDVLDQITYPDGSYTKFHYNDYGQIWKVANFADDDHKLNHVRTNLQSPSADQTDAPKFTETRSWAENFNLESNPTEADQEVLVTNTAPASDSTTLPGSISVSGKYVDVGVAEHPDGLYSRTWFSGSGIYEGLPLATQDCTGSDCAVVKRWTWNDWQQDDPYAAKAVNPRVIESRVGDGTNTKRTTLKYLGVAPPLYRVATYGLVEEVNVYAADLTTVIKKSTVDYNLSGHYTGLRILGLPAETNSWGWNDLTSSLEHVSKVTYAYDQGDFSDSGLQQNISPVQHDPEYDDEHISGRGNLTSTTRWDITAPTTGAAAITSSLKYNTAGSVVSKTTPWDGINTRTVKIGYGDVWNDSVSRTTYAYPTTLTDPANNSSTVKYRFDFGANVEATSPAPAGQTYGKTTKRVFDSIGRLQKDSVFVNTTEQTYSRYEYPSSGVHSKVFSTLVDTNNNGPDSNDEVLSESWFDGAGRVRMSRVPHTFSSGTPVTWAGTLTEYDLLGRVTRQSVPTEVDGSFDPAGDDSVRGFLWNQQEYDWMGRTTRTIPTDSNGSDGKDTLISYAGCGCAGGLETTVQGPLVPRDDDPMTNARRKQKSWADILGRTWKTQTFDWDDDPYLTTEVRFNGRDQTVEVEQTDEEATVTQTSTSSFDGHGRLATSHRPEQRDNSNNLKYTTYTYNLDDSIETVEDGRGVTTNYIYNSRGLVTDIAWNVGSTGITDKPDVDFQYDNLGNRTQMTDGMGVVNYAYDSLSRMTSETRDFTDSLTDAPNSGVFPITYEYTMSGGLKSYTDPYGEEIEYSYEKAGRLTNVDGSSFGSVTGYTSGYQYRAWGAVKQLDHGTDRRTAITYNDRLLPSTQLTNEIATPSNKTFDREYEYFPDAKLKMLDESASSSANKYDRLFSYDHNGRVKEAKSGIEAHGGTETEMWKLPYRQSYTFNAFSNATERDATMWEFENEWDFEYTVVNNRITGYIYDNDGRLVFDPRDSADSNGIGFQYDSAGGMIGTSRTEATYQTNMYRDGEGKEVKRSHRSWIPDEDSEEEGEWGNWETSYFINSSLLGQTVSEVTGTGKKLYTYVIANGSVVARQFVDDEEDEHVAWKYVDASGLSTRSTAAYAGANLKAEEFDALGNDVGSVMPLLPPGSRGNSRSPNESASFSDPMIGDCSYQGVFGPCSFMETMNRFDSPGFRQGSFFAYAHDLPMAAVSSFRGDRDNSGIARDIMRSTGGYDPAPRQETIEEIMGESGIEDFRDEETYQRLNSQINSEECIRALERAGLRNAADRNRAWTNVIRDILGNDMFDSTGTYNTGTVYPNANNNSDRQNDSARPVMTNAQYGNALLSAMALVESHGGISMRQTSGNSNRKGGALGYFQIDRADVGEGEALNVNFAIQYTAYSMASEVGRIAQSIPFDLTDSSLFVPISLMIHNSGGNRDDQDAIRKFVSSRNIADLDTQTTDSYVRKVLNITSNCF